MLKLVIHTDGGARGNPGPAGIGVSIQDAESKEVLEEHAKFLGKTTNNQAEYQAVILGLQRAKKLGASEVDIVTDSELLVKQANGEYRVKNPDLAKERGGHHDIADLIKTDDENRLGWTVRSLVRLF